MRATPPQSALARLLAVVAHDLRQPLSTIAQGAELLLEDADGGESAERREITERVARSAGHATELVRQVLELTRLEQDRVPLRVEDVPLDALCEAVARDVDGDGARLRVDLSPVRAHVDPGRLRQVVVNLLRNALHHGDGARPVTLRVARLDGHARVEVHNDGPAIPAERHAAIFEPFSGFDGGGTGTGTGAGTGLGLYIADQIVRAHGGELQLSSSDGDGTTFAVVLPLGAVTLDVA